MFCMFFYKKKFPYNYSKMSTYGELNYILTLYFCIFFLFIIKNYCFLIFNTLFLPSDFNGKIRKLQIKED